MYRLDFDEKNGTFIPKHKRESVKKNIADFHKLPEKAQDLFLEQIFGLVEENDRYDDLTLSRDILGIPNYYDICQSPIEVILLYAIEILNIHLCADIYVDYIPQHEIIANGKKRIMDICAMQTDDCYNHIKPLFFIECDGFEYHAGTKENFTNTTQKDREIAIAGYEVLHFSGSEIFNNPFNCAYQVINFAKEKIKNG